MNQLHAWCFGVLTVFVTVASVSALECYTCLSCSDPFDTSTAKTTTCDGSCLKTKIQDTVTRACSPKSFGNSCEDNNANVKVCSCTTDLCNSASGMSFPFFGFLLSVVARALWMK
ncbi:uncharacterized protein LOC123554754 isoform X1 [Mercenaria mercenaria]|uniref:uncharacterized protein LOC123554754 isoform X1 n=1 Tax=Mercenaria mercenaria TaxID=6596 RepID=UPI00234E6ED9|nr:uncharacterized protein LOC123554754 isoform X1 [Mercenaria mercenaria]